MIEGTEDGKVIKTVFPPKAPIIRSLHPYPTPPFPAEQNYGLIDVLLRKRISPEAEKWVLERLQRAQEFCDVPEDWEIGPRKEEDASEDDAGDEDNSDEDEDDEEKPFKIRRRKRVLTEEEFRDLWADASKQAAIAAERLGNEEFDAAEDEGESGEDDDDDDDIEMVDSKAVAVQDGLVTVGASSIAGPGAGAAAARAQAPLPLGAILKFMSTGATDPA